MSTTSDEQRIIRASMSNCRVADDEKSMREQAQTWPEYRVAHTARKFALDVGWQLSQLLPETGTTFDGAHPVEINRAAGIRLGVIGTRSSGAAIATLAVGYEPETGPSLRKIVECVLKARRIGDDPSGQYAKHWMEIGKAGDLAKLAQRYGEAREIRLLDRMSHSDGHGVGFFSVRNGENSEPKDLNARPVRHEEFSKLLFLQIAYETVRLAMAVAELFDCGLEIPPFLHDGLLARAEGRSPVTPWG